MSILFYIALISVIFVVLILAIQMLADWLTVGEINNRIERILEDLENE